MTTARDRIIVALDRSKRDDLLRLADQLSGEVGWLKIGLQAFVANGPAIVRELAERDVKIFLDLKFHDIPNTAANAVREALALGAHMTNVHAAGGAAMLSACAEASAESSILLGVTILTSLADDDLAAIGYSGTAEQNVVRLAKLCADSGLNGVVASPNEVRAIREGCGESFVIVTPGIRPEGDDAGDQKRMMTPRQAVDAGSTYLVIGRPITSASDPRGAAARIVAQLG